MHTLQQLDFGQVYATQHGIFANAKFPGWCHEYNFFIQSDGEVKGKTSSGMWQGLSMEASSFVKAKVRSFLIYHPRPGS